MAKKCNSTLENLERSFHDCIVAADIAELREIDKVLDSLKDLIDENILSMSGHGGDW